MKQMNVTTKQKNFVLRLEQLIDLLYDDEKKTGIYIRLRNPDSDIGLSDTSSGITQ